MLRLAFVIVFLVGVYVALDLTARTVAENQLAQAIDARTNAKGVTVRVESLPFLFDLLARGSVQVVDIQLEQVPVGRVELAQVDVSARTVRIDRDRLLRSRRIEVMAISSAEVRVTVTAAELSAAIHRRVVLAGNDTVEVAIGPVMVPATIGIVGGHVLTLSERGLQLIGIDLATSAVVPRCAMRLTVSRGSATLACQVAPVPPSLVAAISAGG